MPNAIEVRHLTRRFGAFVAVDDVSFEVGRGEIFGFLGSNGAGQVHDDPHALRAPAAVVGHGARRRDRRRRRDPEGVKQRIGYMSQRFSLYELLTVDQNISFFGGIYGLTAAQLAERRAFVLEMAGLNGREQTLARDLAGGWRQRLALGCAILHAPAILFLDEPTGGVDPLSRRQFWRLIDTLAASGVTVLVTTHYLDEAERCHRVALIHAGRLATIGTTSEVKQVFAGRPIVEVRTPQPIEAMRAARRHAGGGEDQPVRHRRARRAARRRALRRASSRDGCRPPAIPVDAIDEVPPSLEDVFLDVVETAERARGTAA